MADRRRTPVLLLRVDAPRATWLAHRREGIGGSDALAVLGLHESVSAYEVWADKLNLLPGKKETMPMTIGKLLEPVLARYFTTTTGVTVRRAGMYAHAEHRWMRYNPDRLTGDGGLLEIKTTSALHAEDWAEGRIPAAAEAQTRHGMAVLNRGHAWILALIGGQRPVLRRIDRDPVLEANMIAVERSFWHEHVLARCPPHPDGSRSCTRTLTELYRNAEPGTSAQLDENDLSVLEELASLKRRAKHTQKSITELENWLKHRLGYAETGTLRGKPLVHWRQHHRAGYQVPAATYRKLHILWKEPE
ncbi:YqaJ viral recombinase family protein [Crossiella sp. CA-258035]|uniref:YqaJ viral recombinase family nuclease n=1 Tax=Crossiella sp. CA-258035 TaxID=2981138 RepID=UPI0024BC5FF6|nr:YqaJ viral recombinase family protein [Crossiella sp. CA-258035]WHT22560.1 YqaJ viral recombinase family protein [Crossiella sp. CA-258035]